MIRNDVFQEVKPEQRQRSEHRAFVGNRVRQHDVEGGDAVANYNQQLVFDRINVSNFAASEKLDTKDISLSDYVNSRASSIGLSCQLAWKLLLTTKGFVMALRIISMSQTDVKH